MTEIAKVDFLGVPILSCNLKNTANLIFERIRNQEQIVHACMNAAITVMIRENPVFWECIKKADIISADGQAVVWASRLLGGHLPSRVPGPDLMEEMIEIASRNRMKIFLLGAEQPIVEKVVDVYSKKFGPEIVAGFKNGYFSPGESDAIASEINNSKADFLFVAIPSPSKEFFIEKYRTKMPNVKLLMGVGGTFDVISGKVKRAPRWMQDNGLEWLYRLSREPGRLWKRYLFGNTKFIFIILREYLKKLTK